MRVRFAAVAATAAAVVAAVVGVPSVATGAGLPMAVAPVNEPSSLVQFPVYDAAGTLLRQATYRVTMAGGNCCEKYVAATATGRLLELGGSYPHFSDDGGVTWHRATTPVPLVNGEGAISAAPGGDVVGIGWDAYTGDRLVAYKYTAATGTWNYQENPVHLSGFDRPWLTVVKGPFATATGSVPYVVIARGGLSLGRDVELISYDGLTYVEPSVTPGLAGLLDGRPGPLPVQADADTDLLQSHASSHVAPLPGSGAVRQQEGGVLCRSRLQVLEADRSWTCLDLPGQVFTGHLRADSRGWLHEVRYGVNTVTYRLSRDGGATWQQTTATVPGGPAAALTGTQRDVKVDSVRGRAYVAVRVGLNSMRQQDLVLRFDHGAGAPALAEVSYIGRGDLAAGSNAGTVGVRFDFVSLALLPDGRFAVSYLDSTTGVGNSRRPGLAVLQ